MPKILVIDDRTDNLIALEALLDDLIPECEVITAQSGMDGIEKAYAEMPDTILLDIQMPVMDGYEATVQIRKEHDKESLPILAMTADALTGEKEKSISFGMNDHITKPVNPDILYSSIANWVKPKAASIET
ncbi:MAG: response regulator, partial [Candidatus Aminicenantes bacterium]